MVDPWSVAALAVKVLPEAYANRTEIAKLWLRISAKLTDRDHTIAITGMPGVGKTVLFDHLTSDIALGYTPEHSPSRTAESDRLYRAGAVQALTVVPGQVSPERHTTLDGLFAGKRKVDGVIHVVSNGFTTLRTEADRYIQESGLSLNDFRNQQRQAELVDFDETANYIRGSARKNGRPTWLAIVVDKADLFWTDQELAEAKRHYALPGGTFHEKVAGLASQLGKDKFSIEFLPVCAWLEDFNWGPDTVRSSLRNPGRDALLFDVLKMIDSYCGRPR